MIKLGCMSCRFYMISFNHLIPMVSSRVRIFDKNCLMCVHFFTTTAMTIIETMRRTKVRISFLCMHTKSKCTVSMTVVALTRISIHVYKACASRVTSVYLMLFSPSCCQLVVLHSNIPNLEKTKQNTTSEVRVNWSWLGHVLHFFNKTIDSGWYCRTFSQCI